MGYLILSAVQPNLSLGIFWRLVIGTVVMLAFGYMGEARMVNPMMGFVVGMAGWGFILFEIFAGEAGSVAADGDKVDQNVKSAFNTMRLIVTAGWCIYPLGYFFNKIAFCLAIWQAAKADTFEKISNWKAADQYTNVKNVNKTVASLTSLPSGV